MRAGNTGVADVLLQTKKQRQQIYDLYEDQTEHMDYKPRKQLPWRDDHCDNCTRICPAGAVRMICRTWLY